MFYTVYKITNKINGKIYIGVHKTSNLDDDYMGSGELIKKAIKKYGVDNFTKKYISIFENSEEMFNMESILVNAEFITRTDTYNLKEGGNGGDTSQHIQYDSCEYKENMSTAMIKFYNDNPERKIEAADRIKKLGKYSFLGKKHTDESKKKIGVANSKHQKGKNNSQYGTCWIHSPTLKINKKIKKSEINLYLSDGWIKGRKIKV